MPQPPARTLQVISPISWISETFKQYGGTPHQELRCLTHNGLAPVTDIGSSDAVWIAPELLIALNTWLTRHGRAELQLEGPTDGWMQALPDRLLGRATATATVNIIRSWNHYPADLGARPWSQLHQGRIGSFRAARRTLEELQAALKPAPTDSLIELGAHIPGISEEWCVLVHNGRAQAACGYCIHDSPSDSDAAEESHDIRTIFDGARFHEDYRTLALEAAQQAATAAYLGNASVIVAFQKSPIPVDGTAPVLQYPFIIEADPVWCTAPYPFESGSADLPTAVRRERGFQSFLDAIADARIAPAPGNTAAIGSPERQAETKSQPPTAYHPDPWMVARFSRRYLSFS